MFRVSDKLQLIASSAFCQFMRIVTTFVMLREIGPSENGAFFLVLYVAGFLISLGNFAIPQTLVQIQGEAEDVLYDTAMVLDVGIYSIYGIFTLLCGLVLTHHYGDPELWRLGLIIGVTNILGAVYEVQLASLNRKLDFRAESWQNVVFSIATATTGISLALLGWGVYAIALQLFAGQLIANLVVAWRVPLKWPRRASWALAKRFLGLGTPIAASTYTWTIESCLVGLVINSFAGQFGVGLWGKTVQVQQLFADNLISSFRRVAYPLLCRSVGDPERLRMLFYRVTRILIMVSLLFTVIVAVNCSEMVTVVMGSKWLAAAPLVRITAIAIPAGALTMIGYMMCLVLETGKTFLRVILINLLVFIPVIVLARPWGLVGLAVCWSISRYFIGISSLTGITGRIGARLHTLWRKWIGQAVAAALSAAGMLAVRHWTIVHLRPFVSLSVVCSFGIIIYALVALITERDTILYAMRMARGSKSPGESAETGEEVARIHVHPIQPADSTAFVLSANELIDDMAPPKLRQSPEVPSSESPTP